MKFALIVFLGICALSVQASTTIDFDKEVELLALSDLTLDGIYDKLKEFVNTLVNKVTQITAEIIEKFNNTVSTVVDKVKELVQKATDKFQNIRQQIENKLKEFAEQTAITRECAGKHSEEIMGTLNESKEKIGTCMSTAEGKLKALKEKVQPNIDAIREKSVILGAIFTKCVDTEDKMGTLLCVLKDAREVIDSISALASSAKELIDAGKGEGLDAIRETSTCVGTAYDDGKGKIDALMAEINKCIEEASRSPLLLE